MAAKWLMGARRHLPKFSRPAASCGEGLATAKRRDIRREHSKLSEELTARARHPGKVVLEESLYIESLAKEGSKAVHDHFGSQFVLKEMHPARFVWSVIIVVLLVYTGTIFVYRICFHDFRISLDYLDDELQPQSAEDNSWDEFWHTFDDFVYYTFLVDLFANFFFSYYDEKVGQEIDSLRLIAKNT